MSVQLGNLAIVAGTNTRFQGAPNMGVKSIIIGNESGLTCTITLEGGNVQKTLYPSTLDWFAVKPGFTGTILISPTALLNNTTSWPASSLIFDAIGADDPEEASMYPLPLVRNTNVGNTVSTTGGSTTSVTNDNQPLTPQNQFIEATPTGAPGSTVVIATDGTMTIKGDVAGVLTTLLQLIPGAAAGASSVKLADSTRQTEVLGTLLVDKASSLDNGKITTDGVNGNLTVGGTLTSTGDATFNGAGTGLTVTNNELVSGTLTVTGDATFNGAGTSVACTNNETVGGTLTVTGSSSLDNTKLTTDGSGRISQTPSSTSFPNGTAGSASLTQFFTGSLKVVQVLLTGWEKTTAGDSVVSLPTAFTGWVVGISTDSGPFHLNNNSGVNLTVHTISGFPGAAGSAGADVNGTVGANKNNIFWLPQASPVAQVALFGSQAATALNGMILLVGQ